MRTGISGGIPLHDNFLPTEGYLLGFMRFCSSFCNVYFLNEHQAFFNHDYLPQDGDNHRVAFVADRGWRNIHVLIDRYPMDVHFLVGRRYVHCLLFFMNQFRQPYMPCFYHLLIDTHLLLDDRDGTGQFLVGIVLRVHSERGWW